MKIQKYNITLTTVTEEDAAIIIDFRTDVKRRRFISATDNDITRQREWIRDYKLRENEGKEYYFIAEDQSDVKFATYRVYDMRDGICEIGSWVSAPQYPNANNSVKVDIIIKEFVFETLGYSVLKFSVFRENTTVIKYHKLFEPEIAEETENNIIFHLSKENFFKNRNRIFKNIK